MSAITAGTPAGTPGGVPSTGRPPHAAYPGARVTQRRVVASEWTKLRSLRSTLITLAAAVVFVVALGCLISWGTARHWADMSSEERLTFDPTSRSLTGVFLAQLAVGVLGVLAFSSEYSTGMIRATLGAVPTRLPVLWAKAAVFAFVIFVLMAVAVMIAFLSGQAILSSKGAGTSLTHDGVLTAVLGAGLYLTVVGLLGVALGALLRSTAGGIATLFGILLILPIIVRVMPENWSRHIQRYLPNEAGQAIMNVVRDPHALSPWTGFALFCGYTAVAVAGAAYVLLRRDA